ncbi:MAG: SDR family oxidoreductase [Dehalococcoidia bacterium]|nr:SDR family oxidoreductase [Dehalococcoidia bacterium]
MPDLEGRTALVTGAGRGIGAAIALGLAEAGADVAINYARDAMSAGQGAEAARALGRKAEIFQGDVSDYAQCEALVAAVLKDFGKIDILINNAGIASRGNVIVDTDPAEMERVVRLHAFGSFNMSQLVIPQMREQPRGDIVMISSGAALSLSARGGPYNMAKAAMEALAQTLAKEERANGIHVNVVGPGLVDTEMGRRLVRATRGVTDIREMDATSPFGFVCQPEDIANMVVFLCGPGARYVTNQRIYVNGGGF